MRIARSLGLYVAALAAALAFSTLRLRDLALGGAPFALWLPFLRPLFSAAFEASLLLGVPVAWLSAWITGGAERGLGARRVPLIALGLALTAISAAGAIVTDVGSRAPGLLAQELIDSGRKTCESSPDRKVDVPLVSVAWACPPKGAATISGKSPSLGGAQFRASSLRVSADLRQFELAFAKLELPKKQGRLQARIAAQRAKISGLPPWGRPRHVSLAFRLFFAFVGAFVSMVVVVRMFEATNRRYALFAGAFSGIVLLVAQLGLDRTGATTSGYWVLAPVGALAALAAALAFGASRRAFKWIQARRSSPSS